MNKLQKVEALLSRPIQWPIHRDGVRLIAMAEDCFLVAYLCPAGKWTCGWGETSGVRQGTRWTQEHADGRFRTSLEEVAAEVSAALKVPANEYQFAAIVSLAYNYGKWRDSTVLKCHNRGDFEGAARAFSLINKARVNGVLTVLNGLTTRRAEEAALYLRHDPEAPSERMPQAVQPESSLAASPIAQGGAVAAGYGALEVVSQAKEVLGPVSETAEKAKALVVGTLGLPGWVLPCLLLAVGLGVAFWRWKQRREGWA